MVTPAGAAGVPDGMRELLGPALTGAYAMRSDKVPGGEPHHYTQGRDADVDAAIAQCGLRLPDKPLWWDVVDLLFEAGAVDAAARAQRYAVPTLIDLLASSAREPAVQGLVGDARYGSGGETVTQAFIRILTALSGRLAGDVLSPRPSTSAARASPRSISPRWRRRARPRRTASRPPSTCSRGMR